MLLNLQPNPPMKTSLAFSLAAAGVFAASSPLFGISPENNRALAHRVNAVAHFGAEPVQRGTSMIDVRLTLGAPQRRIGDDTWVYAGFRAGQAQVRGDDSAVLLLRFQNGRVSDIQLVNPRAEKLIAARGGTPTSPETLLTASAP